MWVICTRFVSVHEQNIPRYKCDELVFFNLMLNARPFMSNCNNTNFLIINSNSARNFDYKIFLINKPSLMNLKNRNGKTGIFPVI